MSDHEGVHEDVDEHDAYGNNTYQGCFIWKPVEPDSHKSDNRPTKRRKMKKTDDDDAENCPLFWRLLNGDETPEALQLRQRTFEKLWTVQQKKIDEIVNHVDEDALRSIVRFVKESGNIKHDGRVSTGLVVAGADAMIQKRLLSQWRKTQSFRAKELVIQLESTHAPNLTTALKHIIRNVITQIDGQDGYQAFLNKHKKLIPMNYDLELLQYYATEKKIEKFVISVLDVEAFDVGVLSGVVSLFSSWGDRIPFVLLLGIATTVELFEARLHRSTIRLLDATVFDMSSETDSLYEIYRAVQTGPETKLWLGPAVASILLDRTKDQDATPELIGRAVKYAYMSHFFANPLSILLEGSKSLSNGVSPGFCEAIRNTDSFREYAESQMSRGKRGAQVVHKLLNDDHHLLQVAWSAMRDSQTRMTEHHEAVSVLKYIRWTLNIDRPYSSPEPFEIDLEALSSSDFLATDVYTTAISALQRLDSSQLLNFPQSFSAIKSDLSPTRLNELNSYLRTMHSQLTSLCASFTNSIPIRSRYDPSHPTMTISVSAQKTASLSSHTVPLTKTETQYTAVIDSFISSLDKYFTANVLSGGPRSLFLHEAFVYDLRSPLASAFTPRPRHAIERALTRPGDYLGCECCAGVTADGTRDAQQLAPPTSVLWRLWSEAGGIVNARDLWEAFRDIVGAPAADNSHVEDGEGGDDADDGAIAANNNSANNEDDRRALALFYRSLSELRLLGAVKSTKRTPKPGVDCLAKSAWAGM